MRRRTKASRGKPHVFKRFARFVRALFSSGGAGDELDDNRGGGLGVREPRRPLQPTLSGAVALETPPDELRDVWAVGEDDSR